MRRPGYFYGWNVVAVTLVMALFRWGFGFYGPSVYLASLQDLHGWSASAAAPWARRSWRSASSSARGTSIPRSS